MAVSRKPDKNKIYEEEKNETIYSAAQPVAHRGAVCGAFVGGDRSTAFVCVTCEPCRVVS